MADIDRTEIDGAPATQEELEKITSAYGHFTAMQVRKGATRGLDLHLRRLAETNRERFGTELDRDRILALIRSALGDVEDASVRVYLHDASPEARIVVTVKPAGELPSPQRLRSVRYQRPDAHVKHVVTEQGRYREQVQHQGYDDALLTTDDGEVSETSMTNIGFFDGDAVVWPDAPLLHGVTMQLLEDHLPARGTTVRRQRIRVADIGALDGVFLSNARGIAAVSAVDDIDLPIVADRVRLLEEAYAAVPWDPISQAADSTGVAFRS
jgi:branched-subunit amino acid aminotransferase/4-amino-4-deoxychorismate lyase